MTPLLESTDLPDWSQIAYDVHCPLCEYNLRGLREPRCPECGYRFDWPEILNRKRTEHPYLFEHHPNRNTWSYWQTLRGTWQPRSFWKTLHPTQRSRPVRLLIFWLLGLPLLLLANLAMYLGSAALEINAVDHERAEVAETLRHSRQDMSSFIAQWGSMEQYLNRYFPRKTFSGILTARLNAGEFPDALLLNHILVPLIWPWVLLLALLVFQISMRKARIKTVHVLRCVLYCYDLSLWAGVLLVAAGVVSLFWDGRWFEGTLRLTRDLIIVLGTYRVWIAYRMYLRFDHALATAVSAQVIAILATMAFFCLMSSRVAYRELLVDPLFRLIIGAS